MYKHGYVIPSVYEFHSALYLLWKCALKTKTHVIAYNGPRISLRNNNVVRFIITNVRKQFIINSYYTGKNYYLIVYSFYKSIFVCVERYVTEIILQIVCVAHKRYTVVKKPFTSVILQRYFKTILFDSVDIYFSVENYCFNFMHYL